jgi:hypothetical protein
MKQFEREGSRSLGERTGPWVWVSGVGAVVLSLCLVSVLVADTADVAPGAKAIPPPSQKTPLDKEKNTQDAEPAKPDKPARDPFTYGGHEDAGYVSVANTHIPGNIELLGVIVMKGEKPIAAIRVAGEDAVVFITEGSVVQVVAPTSDPKRKANQEPIYIFINRITADEVEVSPRTRPEDRRILR